MKFIKGLFAILFIFSIALVSFASNEPQTTKDCEFKIEKSIVEVSKGLDNTVVENYTFEYKNLVVEKEQLYVFTISNIKYINYDVKSILTSNKYRHKEYANTYKGSNIYLSNIGYINKIFS